MAWTDQCKIDAQNQVEHKTKHDNISKTIENWVWPEKNSPENGGTQSNEKKEFETCAEKDLFALIDSGKKYSTIYADPPWQYSNQATRSSTSNHYDTMTNQDIADLPINKLTTENAHLHLWTTNAFLFDAKTIMEAWGFEYKSCLVWVKPQMGIGNYWRVSHEFLLFGLKGKQSFLNRGQKSWIEHDRTKHSKKPEIISDIIEKVSPGAYLELFGRRVRKNWTVWGNEIQKGLFYDNI